MKWWFFLVPLNFDELVNLGWRNREVFSTSDVSTKKQVTTVISFLQTQIGKKGLKFDQ